MEHAGASDSLDTEDTGRQTSFAESPRVNTDNKLCARCFAIDIDAVLNVDAEEIGSTGVKLLSLGILSPDQRQSECHLCALFASSAFGPLGATILKIKEDVKEEQQWQLRAYNCLRMFNLSHTKRRLGKATSVVFHVVPVGNNKLTRRTRNNFEFTYGNVILPVNLETKRDQCKTSYSYEGRLIQPLGIDYDVISGWLAECDLEHKKTCAPAKKGQITASRLIDCRTKEVVPATAAMGYFTLSYVWGPNPQLATLELSGSEHCQKLPKSLPRTIEDAITVVLALEQCYLWIDRYCIDQEPGSRTRQAELMRMDEIYEAAEACLVATGPDDSSGLYGVSKSPRLQQPQAYLGNKILVSSLPHVSVYLKNSKWTYRGWTYQEAQLSKRCIIFTDAQTYFVCQQGRQAEAVQLGLVDSCDRKAYLETLMEPNSFETKFNPCRRYSERSSYFETKVFDYCEGLNTSLSAKDSISYSQTRIHEDSERMFTWNHISEIQPTFQIQMLEYTGRELTRDSDALDAFRGILARSGNVSYFGIPVFVPIPLPGVDSGDALINLGFSLGMAWARFKDSGFFSGQAAQPESPVDRRRQDFPSWSWTSIRGTTGFTLAYESIHVVEYLTMDWEKFSNSPTYYFTDEKGHSYPMAKQFRQQAGCRNFMIPEKSKFMILKCYAADCYVTYNRQDGLQLTDWKSLAPLLNDQSPDKAGLSRHPVLDLFLDNTNFDIARAQNQAEVEPTYETVWRLFLLFQKESKEQNYRICWWILTYGDGDTYHRVGLVRTWSLPEEGLPIKKTVICLG